MVMIPIHEFSQVMNFHNLCHVVDDVEFMKAPLLAFSAYPFENYLGLIRKLIRTPNNPLAQIYRRLNEMQSVPSNIIQKNKVLSDCLKKNFRTDEENATNCDLLEIKLNNCTIRAIPPNNIVLLEDGKVVSVTKLFIKDNNYFLEGYCLNVENAFLYPCESKFVGVFEVISTSKNTRCYSCEKIVKKCLKFKIGIKLYVTELLHM